MANVTLPQVGNSGAPSIIGDEAANVDTILKRDSNADSAIRRLTVAGLIGTGYVKGGKYAFSTSITIDEDTYKGMHYVGDATSGNLTCGLPAAASSAGRIISVTKYDATANTITVDGNSSETIGPDADASIVLVDEGETLLLCCDGTGWSILSHYSMFTGLQYSNTAASAAHTDTTTEALFDKNFTFQANMLRAGDVIKIRYQGICSSTTGATTLTIKLYFGGLSGTAILTGTATDVADNHIFAGEATIVIRTIGGSGTFVAVGTHTDVPAASGTASHAITEITGSTTIDTTATIQVGVGADWSAADANTCRLDIFTVERLRAQM